RAQIAAVEARDVPVASGKGEEIFELRPDLEEDVWRSYEDAQKSLIIDMPSEFVARFPDALELRSTAGSRDVHNLEPKRGERLDSFSRAALEELRRSWKTEIPEVVLMISDGLNARAVMDPGHLSPFLVAVRNELEHEGVSVAKRPVFLHHGRVRAGYSVAKTLFGEPTSSSRRALVHFIGERPGTPHQNASVYLTDTTGEHWASGRVDHDDTRVVSGISDSALDPERAASVVVQLLRTLRASVH
ncbi:MAG: ethanolamine ammonia-lyase light chain EutC, partial [Myxococcota bacterium]